MNLSQLTALKNKLDADAALTAYWMDTFHRAARHVVGAYEKPLNATRMPTLCYVPVTETRPNAIGGRGQATVRVVVQINKPNVALDNFDAATALDGAKSLIFAALESGGLGQGAIYLGDESTAFDFETYDQFHEMALTLRLQF